MADYNPNQNDLISISESITMEISYNRVDVNDSISISEGITNLLPELNLSVNDEIDISDLNNSRFKEAADPDIDMVADTIASIQTIRASAILEAGSETSSSFKVQSALMLRFFVNVTAEVGVSLLNITLQTSPDNLKWYGVSDMDTISLPGRFTKVMTDPGVYVRIVSTVTGAATSFTFSIKMAKHMPIRRYNRIRRN